MGRQNRLGVYELPEDAELADVFRVHGRKIKMEIRTHVPATVVSYNPATQQATVTVDALETVAVIDETQAAKIIAQGGVVEGTPPNAEATLPPIKLNGIPVAWPRTNLGYVTFPLNPGDTGELIISDRSLDQWLLKGIPSDPKYAGTHAIENGVFHPGLHALANPIVPPTDTAATVLDGAALVKVGRLATSFLAKSPELIAAVDALLLAGVNAGGTAAANFTAATVAWNAVKAQIPTTKAMGE